MLDYCLIMNLWLHFPNFSLLPSFLRTFVFLFDLILYVPVNNLSVTSGWVFLGCTSTKLGLMSLSQGHNSVMRVRLEPTAPRP